MAEGVLDMAERVGDTRGTEQTRCSVPTMSVTSSDADGREDRS